MSQVLIALDQNGRYIFYTNCILKCNRMVSLINTQPDTLPLEDNAALKGPNLIFKGQPNPWKQKILHVRFRHVGTLVPTLFVILYQKTYSFRFVFVQANELKLVQGPEMQKKIRKCIWRIYIGRWVLEVNVNFPMLQIISIYIYIYIYHIYMYTCSYMYMFIYVYIWIGRAAAQIGRTAADGL